MYNFIKASVGAKGRNLSEDVKTIQIRLNRWVMLGRLPGVEMLAVDGQCGTKTKQAIGAFQLRYVDIAKPDSRVDPGGKTLALLFTSLIETTPQRVPDNTYIDWLNSGNWQSQQVDDAPFWEKRGPCWVGVGVKTGGGALHNGTDLCLCTLYNTTSPGNNRFVLTAHTKRVITVGAGATAGAVLCFVTGIYHPSSLGKIQSAGTDWNVAIAGKWKGLASWAVKIPHLTKLVSAAKISKYADLDTVSKVVTTVKSGMGAFGVSETDPNPGFVAIDIPLGGYGMELAYYYGVTSYHVSNVELGE